jgi:hypothetical protein
MPAQARCQCAEVILERVAYGTSKVSATPAAFGFGFGKLVVKCAVAPGSRLSTGGSMTFESSSFFLASRSARRSRGTVRALRAVLVISPWDCQEFRARLGGLTLNPWLL